jgi:hypothetical protein
MSAMRSMGGVAEPDDEVVDAAEPVPVSVHERALDDG